jgi:RNA polymerase sigma-70 factor (ECF subfamily)
MSALHAAAALRGLDSASVAERYRPALYRYILRLVRDPARAEDLTQETLLRVHQHLHELNDGRALEGWLYRIATNVCYDRFRQREHRHPAEPLQVAGAGEQEDGPLPDETALRPDQLAEQNGMSECVQRFLARLPESQRTVLLLHDLQGYTDPEIARRLGLSLENVKMRLHRARAELKAALTEGCEFSCNDRGVFICEPKSTDS